MYLVIKRTIDISLAILVLLLSLPVFVILIFILKCTGEGKVFFFQERVGFKNKRFKIWKFATMVEDNRNINAGRATVRNDPRVTSIGKILRKTKLNELPQVINILKGDMTLIGPRPLISRGFENYSKEIQKRIYNVRPGLTGIGSVIFRDEETLVSNCSDVVELYKSINRHKGRLELWYQQYMGVKTDLLIIFLTGYSIFVPKQRLTYQLFKNLPMPEENRDLELTPDYQLKYRKE